MMLYIFYGCSKYPEPYTHDGVIKGAIDGASGCNVTLSGPYGKKSINTDVQPFLFEHLGNGTYELSVSRNGFGTMKYFGVQVFGIDTIYIWTHLTKSYADYPPPELKSVRGGGDNNSYYIDVDVDFSSCCQGNDPSGLVFFISTSKGVSCTQYLYTVKGYPFYDYNNKYAVTFGFQFFRLDNFTEYYIKGYSNTPEGPDSNYDNYWDPSRGIIIYASMNYSAGTNTLSFTLPPK